MLELLIARATSRRAQDERERRYEARVADARLEERAQSALTDWLRRTHIRPAELGLVPTRSGRYIRTEDTPVRAADPWPDARAQVRALRAAARAVRAGRRAEVYARESAHVRAALGYAASRGATAVARAARRGRLPALIAHAVRDPEIRDAAARAAARWARDLARVADARHEAAGYAAAARLLGLSWTAALAGHGAAYRGAVVRQSLRARAVARAEARYRDAAAAAASYAARLARAGAVVVSEERVSALLLEDRRRVVRAACHGLPPRSRAYAAARDAALAAWRAPMYARRGAALAAAGFSPDETAQIVWREHYARLVGAGVAGPATPAPNWRDTASVWVPADRWGPSGRAPRKYPRGEWVDFAAAASAAAEAAAAAEARAAAEAAARQEACDEARVQRALAARRWEQY